MTAIFYREKKTKKTKDSQTNQRPIGLTDKPWELLKNQKHAGAPLPPVVVKKGKERKEIRTK